MPAFVKTAADEKRWDRAKDAVSKSRDKKQSDFTDRDWGLVNSIYQKMKESLDEERKKNKKKRSPYLDTHRIGRSGPYYGPADGTSPARVGAIATPSGSVTVSGATGSLGEQTSIAFAEKQIKQDPAGEYEQWLVKTTHGKEYILVADTEGFVLIKDGLVQMTGKGDPWEEFRMVTGITRDELHQVVAESTIIETKESEQEIRKIAKIVTNLLARRLRNIEHYPQINLRLRPELYQVYEGPLEDFIRQSDLNILLVPREESIGRDAEIIKSAGASYSSLGKVIEVYLSKTYFNLIREKDRRLRSGTIDPLKKSIESHLIHELTHAYDDYRSEGKYHEKDYPEDLTGKNLGKYYGLPSEVNAYFAQAVKDAYPKKLRFGDPKESWSSYWKEFESQFKPWKSLTDEQKKRVRGRAYNEFFNLTDSEAEEIIKQAFAEWYEDDLRSGDIPKMLKIDTRVANQNQREVLRKALWDVVHGKEDKKSEFYSSIFEMFLHGLEKPAVQGAIQDFFGITDDQFKFISQEMGLI